MDTRPGKIHKRLNVNVHQICKTLVPQWTVSHVKNVILLTIELAYWASHLESCPLAVVSVRSTRPAPAHKGCPYLLQSSLLFSRGLMG